MSTTKSAAVPIQEMEDADLLQEWFDLALHTDPSEDGFWKEIMFRMEHGRRDPSRTTPS